MKFSIFIDYASLYNSASKIVNADLFEEKFKIEDCIIDIVIKLKKYLKKYYPYKKVEIVSTKAYILPDKHFNISENKLKKAEIEGIRVSCDLIKSKTLKALNGSRLDDKYLKLGVVDNIEKNFIDGVVIISNDSDYIDICNAAINEGKYSWILYYESKNTSVKRELKESPDVALSITELLSEKEEVYEKIKENNTHIISGKRLEFYRNNELVYQYPLKRKSLSLGRRSIRKNHIPNIDLTDIDKDKIISRYHADIHFVNDKRLVFCVNKDCSRGTWYNKKAKRPNEQFLVEEGYPILLGDKNGFLMYYFSK